MAAKGTKNAAKGTHTKVSKKTEVEPKKLSKEERILQNIKDNETHIHEIDVAELNKETVEEILPGEEVIIEEILIEKTDVEQEFEIIDVAPESTSVFEQSIIKTEVTQEPYINEQINNEADDLKRKMSEAMEKNELIRVSETGEIINNIEDVKLPENINSVKHYSNTPQKNTESEPQVNPPVSLSKSETTQIKLNTYSNIQSVNSDQKYTEHDIITNINKLMVEKSLSYLEAKAIVYDKLKRGEALARAEEKKVEVKTQQQPKNEVKQNNTQISTGTKIYTNNQGKK